MIGILLSALAVTGVVIASKSKKTDPNAKLPPTDAESLYVDDTVSSVLVAPKPPNTWLLPDDKKETPPAAVVKDTAPASTASSTNFFQQQLIEANRKKELEQQAAERNRPDKFPLILGSKGERVSTLQRNFINQGVRVTGVFDQAFSDFLYNSRLKTRVISEQLYKTILGIK